MFQKLSKEDIFSAVKRAGGGETLVASEILSTVELWLQGRFGKQVMTMCQPASVVGNTLRIKSQSPPLSNEIKQHEKALLNHVRAQHPNCNIDRLQIIL